MTALNDEAALAKRIADYLSHAVGHPVEVSGIRRFPVGFSWLTYAVPVTGLRMKVMCRN